MKALKIQRRKAIEMKVMKVHLWAFGLLVFLPIITNAHTSIALVENYVTQSWFNSTDYESQKEADNDALEGCRVTARQRGIGNLAKQCKVVTRATGPGHGALACSENGCSWSIGHGTLEEAVTVAREKCSKTYANCQDTLNWKDFKGFASKSALLQKSQVPGDCRPRSNQLQCTSSCTNGSCVVTYQNGCQIRVQVQPQFNPLNNTWDYPAPSC
ncbi:DUF4189 domain-containing protein [Duganella sp. HSC-15S17]|uniref:DUF4189 domain-containing protein n=1 Tax=Duganella violaceipulchra TaxID=2849652 RepID=A0AA41L2C4_9BURK|nr:DUF4189 domain-containing protein [Duganella violaceicalia]